MAKAKIKLSLLNSKGCVAGLESGDFDSVDLVQRNTNRNAKAVCLEAASRLRKLADAFERLATMEEPFKEVTQRVAQRQAEKDV